MLPALVGTGASFHVTHGLPYRNLVASYIDANKLDTAVAYSATIPWGDGVSTPARIVGARGTFAITDQPTGGHVYGLPGTYTVTVEVVDPLSSMMTPLHSTAIVH